MAEFKLNEEQEKLMKKFSDDVNKLIEKYSNMEEAFEVTINIVKTKISSCEDENIKDIQEKVETLQRQTRYVTEKLGKITYFTKSYDRYENDTSLLIEAQSLISAVIYELGKLEGYSSGNIHTYSDTHTFLRNFEALKNSLLEEKQSSES